jgi:hypothetical protein
MDDLIRTMDMYASELPPESQRLTKLFKEALGRV